MEVLEQAKRVMPDTIPTRSFTDDHFEQLVTLTIEVREMRAQLTEMQRFQREANPPNRIDFRELQVHFEEELRDVQGRFDRETRELRTKFDLETREMRTQIVDLKNFKYWLMGGTAFCGVAIELVMHVFVK